MKRRDLVLYLALTWLVWGSHAFARTLYHDDAQVLFRVFSDPGGTVRGAFTQFAGTHNSVLRDQNGYTSGTLQDFSIDRTGTIVGAFTNGTTSPLGQIVLSDFNNPGGLMRIGDNMYSTSGNSGSPVYGFALEGSQSVMVSGALEMSNVDLAQEFTSMIVAERGYQANSRVITTSDRLLEELVSLKR